MRRRGRPPGPPPRGRAPRRPPPEASTSPAGPESHSGRRGRAPPPRPPAGGRRAARPRPPWPAGPQGSRATGSRGGRPRPLRGPLPIASAGLGDLPGVAGDEDEGGLTVRPPAASALRSARPPGAAGRPGRRSCRACGARPAAGPSPSPWASRRARTASSLMPPRHGPLQAQLAEERSTATIQGESGEVARFHQQRGLQHDPHPGRPLVDLLRTACAPAGGSPAPSSRRAWGIA